MTRSAFRSRTSKSQVKHCFADAFTGTTLDNRAFVALYPGKGRAVSCGMHRSHDATNRMGLRRLGRTLRILVRPAHGSLCRATRERWVGRCLRSRNLRNVHSVVRHPDRSSVVSFLHHLLGQSVREMGGRDENEKGDRRILQMRLSRMALTEGGKPSVFGVCERPACRDVISEKSRPPARMRLLKDPFSRRPRMAPFIESVLEQVKGDVAEVLSVEKIEQICRELNYTWRRVYFRSRHHRPRLPEAGLGREHGLRSCAPPDRSARYRRGLLQGPVATPRGTLPAADEGGRGWRDAGWRSRRALARPSSLEHGWFRLLDARHTGAAAGLWPIRHAKAGLWISGGPSPDAVSRLQRISAADGDSPLADARHVSSSARARGA